MRHAQPVLLEGEFCADCPLRECAERHTDAACRGGPMIRTAVHPGNWPAFEQRLSWARTAVGPRTNGLVPGIPTYFTRVPRDIDPQALTRLPSAAISMSLQDFLLLARTTAAGTNIRDRFRLGDRLLVVVGSDPDRVCDAHWKNWDAVLERIVADPPDLVIGPDLSFYEHDTAAARLLNFNSHTVMYADLTNRGIAALPPFGWVYPSDVQRFVRWARRFKVPGAFLDLQRRTPASAFDVVVGDLRRMRHCFPGDFIWLINGVQVPERMRRLQAVLGDVRFTSAGPWQRAASKLIINPGTLRTEPTTLPVLEAFVQNVLAMTAAAEASCAASRTLRHRPRPRPAPRRHAGPPRPESDQPADEPVCG